VDVKGEILELKNTINTMWNSFVAFASEVTRVARELVLKENWVDRQMYPEWWYMDKTN